MKQLLLPIPSVDAFVEQHAKEPLYYQHKWHDLLAKLYGYSVIELSTTDNEGQITGYLPLCYVQSPITGRRLVSLPFCDQCSLLALDTVAAENLVGQAVELAQQRKVKYLELRTGVNETLPKRSDFVEENLYVRWYLPLSTNPDAMWANLRRQVQQQIRKSQSSGVSVRRAQKREDVSHYYNLHLQTRSKKHGMPSQSDTFFLTLWDTYAVSGKMQVFLAEYQEQVIASIIVLASGQTARFAYGASNEQYLNLAPNNLLWWEAIKWSGLQGYQTIDTGRTARSNKGLMEFKRRWGAIEEALPYYYYPHQTGLACTSEESQKYRLLTSCWKKLPISLSGPLGGYIYKHLG